MGLLAGWRGVEKLNGLFYWKWLVIFYFSFMKDDRTGKLDGDGVNCFESVF